MTKLLISIVIKTILFFAGIILGVGFIGQFATAKFGTLILYGLWVGFLSYRFTKTIRSILNASPYPEKLTAIIMGMAMFVCLILFLLAWAILNHFFPNLVPVHKIAIAIGVPLAMVGLMISMFLLILEKQRLSRS